MTKKIFYPASEQHVTAGPYSPVIGVRSDAEIFVISGQAPLNLDGEVESDDFEEQSRVTMENCLTQLNAAGCGFEDVFKATIYLTDLANWDRFNVVYREMMPNEFPARTAIGCFLLPGFQVEIEMWAAK